MKKYNRLGEEKSPYLLQHKDNPVHWFPWGDEAFRAAREENKIIFLSIGYSTCYWCHMMEKDSFEREDVAEILNKDFISIKVDREEHPDVDQIYMDAVVGMTGRGGWPLSIFLTPDLKPFFGGTFFWRPQFLQLLSQIQDSWQKNPEKILESGTKITEFLQKESEVSGTANADTRTLQKTFQQLEKNFDKTNGGFGGAPKFPHSMELSLLLRIHRRTGSPKALAMVTQTLDAMARGGIYDDIGGGFHRYATDKDWNEPHYEKMLYDNALLVWTYLEAYQITKKQRYAEVVTQSLDYVLREMTHPEGGFYSAQDAGEVGKEGDYYRLSKEERSKAPPLHKDDKILTSWNGLMIAAMAKGYQVLGEARYLDAARKSAAFIRQKLYQDGKLLRRYRDGESRYSGTVNDYSFLIHGLLTLYESDFDPQWIGWAVDLQSQQDKLFWDQKNGGYYLAEAEEKSLLVRKKEFDDGVTPSGNSVSVLNLLKLHDLTLDQGYQKRLGELLNAVSGIAASYPAGYSMLMTAIDYHLDRSKEVAVVGRLDDPTMLEIRKFFFESFIPNKVLAMGEAAPLGDSKYPAILQGKTMQNDQPTIYVCENNICKRPTTSLEEAKKLINDFEKYNP
ncbi:MAG: thioredoxin domain-containing protein [Deltaproteobacteria bacterium]|nr:thioredoxin domain-containing protein [Deltaproteobacteria bacterium]